jgi:hypothetical protein
MAFTDIASLSEHTWQCSCPDCATGYFLICSKPIARSLF